MAQYVTLQKYFSHPSLVVYFSFFSTPPIKLKLQIDGRLLINSNPPGPIKLFSQSTAAVKLLSVIHQP
jgi:hypothetical protein